MDKLTIDSGGVLYDGSTMVPLYGVLPHLNRSVVLGEGVTLRSIINFLCTYRHLNEIFPEIDLLHEQRYVKSTNRTFGKQLHLSHQNTMHWTPYKVLGMAEDEDEVLDNGNIRVKFTYDNDVENIGSDSHYSLTEYHPVPEDGEHNFSITMTPIKEIINLPVKMKKDTNLMIVDKKLHKTTEDLTYISLYNLITCITDDILFFDDEDKEEMLEDLVALTKESIGDDDET